MNRGEASRDGPPLFRILLFMVLPLIFFGIALTVFAQRAEDIHYVRASRLNVRERPSRSSPSSHILERGDHVFSLGKQVEREGLTWLRIFLLYKPENAYREERLEGWIAERGPQKAFTDREHNPIKRMIVLRSLYKWKARITIQRGMGRSRLLTRLRQVVPYAGDKILHVILVFLVGSALFVFLASGLGVSTSPAFLVSVVLINLLGLFNEILDLVSGRGAFEIMDLAANAMGSAGIFLPFFFMLLWRKSRPLTRQ